MPFSVTFPRGLRSAQSRHNILPTGMRSSSFPPVPWSRSSTGKLLSFFLSEVSEAGMNLCTMPNLLLFLPSLTPDSLGNGNIFSCMINWQIPFSVLVRIEAGVYSTNPCELVQATWVTLDASLVLVVSHRWQTLEDLWLSQRVHLPVLENKPSGNIPYQSPWWHLTQLEQFCGVDVT